MVLLPIGFVSHPKISFSLRSETSETGGSVLLFPEKKFRYVSLQFRFEAKFGDILRVHIKKYVPAIEIEHWKFTCSISPSSRSSLKFVLVIGRCMLMTYQKFKEKVLESGGNNTKCLPMDNWTWTYTPL